MEPWGEPRRSSLRVRRGRAQRGLLAIVVALCSSAAAGAMGADAQAGTPAADVDAPTPAECTVEPRSEEELRALFRETAATPLPADPAASPTPAVAPVGSPADEATVAAINVTWRQYVACLTAGDQARMFALLSDDMVRRQFAVDIAFGVTEDALFDFLAATPVPIAADQSVPFVPITDARVLSDGRVAAVGLGDRERGDVRIFVREGDRWLLDDWYDLTAEGTPTS